uniref:Uncharacterized protein n=1 Tax=Oryza meridionalis TaxID=40149 RepID=A0A0E0CKG1_9ORYZ
MRWRRVLLGGEGAIGGGLEVADAWPVGIGEVDWARGERQQRRRGGACPRRGRRRGCRPETDPTTPRTAFVPQLLSSSTSWMSWNEGTGLGPLDSLMLADKDTSNSVIAFFKSSRTSAYEI